MIVLSIGPDEKFKVYKYKGSKTDYKISNYGRLYSKKSNRLMVPVINNSGYIKYRIRINKKEISILAHRMVADTFLPKPDSKDKTDIDHINGIKVDNYYLNLEWVTRSENIKRSFEMGLSHVDGGEKAILAKYSDEEIKKCILSYFNGESLTSISERSGISKTNLRSVLRQESRPYIMDELYPLKYNYRHRNKVNTNDKIKIIEMSKQHTLDEIYKTFNYINKDTIRTIIRRYNKKAKEEGSTTIPKGSTLK